MLSKGSPSKIVERCKKETVPKNFEKILKEYSFKGYRILGFSYKENLDKSDLKKDNKEIEQEMIFLGLILLNNPLKEKTKVTLKKL